LVVLESRMQRLAMASQGLASSDAPHDAQLVAVFAERRVALVLLAVAAAPW